MKHRHKPQGRSVSNMHGDDISVGTVVTKRKQRGVVEALQPVSGPGACPLDAVLLVAWFEGGGCYLQTEDADDVRAVGRVDPRHMPHCEGETSTEYGAVGRRWRPPKTAVASWRDQAARYVQQLRARREGRRIPRTTDAGDEGALEAVIARLREIGR